MKIIELLNNIQLPITNEESDLLGKFYEQEKVFKENLSDREHLVASNLVNKNALSRHKKDDKIYYRKQVKF